MTSPIMALRPSIKRQPLVIVIALVIAVNCLNFHVASASNDEEPEESLQQHRKKCITANALTPEQADIVYNHKLFTASTTVENTAKPIQCYCLCYLHESGIFLNGKPNEEFLRQNLPIMINDKKKANDAMDKCMKLHGADECEIGFNFELCIIKETGLYIY